MSTAGVAAELPSGWGAPKPPPVGRTTAYSVEPDTKVTTRRPPSEAATAGEEDGSLRPPSTRSGGCHAPSTRRETKTCSAPASRLR